MNSNVVLFYIHFCIVEHLIIYSFFFKSKLILIIELFNKSGSEFSDKFDRIISSKIPFTLKSGGKGYFAADFVKRISRVI